MRVKCEQSDPRSNTTSDNPLIDHSKVDSAAASVNLSIQWKVQKYMQMSNVIGSIHCSLFRYMFSSYNFFPTSKDKNKTDGLSMLSFI